MLKKIYYNMDDCPCLGTTKPKKYWKWENKVYKCSKCWGYSRGYVEWEL